MKVPTLVF